MKSFIKKIVRREEGQVLVESAIVMPLMVFFTLGIFQLTLIQHARIMTEYGAFCAARSGIVNNGSRHSMEAAANAAIFPTLTRVDSFGRFIGAYFAYMGRSLIQPIVAGAEEDLRGEIDGFLDGLPEFGNAKEWAAGEAGMLVKGMQGWLTQHGLGPTLAHTFIVNPIVADFNGNTEYDFDTPVLHTTDPDDRTIMKNILTVAVSYNFELKVPFANWIIFEAWLASEVGMALSGAVWSARGDGSNDALSGENAVAGHFSGGVGSGTSRLATRNTLGSKANSFSGATVRERIRMPLGDLWSLSNAKLWDGGAPEIEVVVGIDPTSGEIQTEMNLGPLPGKDMSVFLLPIYASYSMRMHSNPFLGDEASSESDNQGSVGPFIRAQQVP